MPPGNTYPAVLVQIAPGVAASAVPTESQWVDVTGYCEGFDIRYGRDDEFAQPSAGQADLRFANDNGLFDADNASGPWYPNLVPLMWLRIKAGTTTPDTSLFVGQVSIEGWRLRASQFPDSTVSVTVLDAFEQLANTQLPSSVYELEVTADNPRAWYRLGESSGTVATDSSGNGHHGTYEGGATFNSRVGLIAEDADNAIEFDGVDDWARLPAGGFPEGVTVEMWVKANTTGGTTNKYLFYRPLEERVFNGYHWALYQDFATFGGALVAQMGTVDATVRSTVTLNDGAPHHVVVTMPGVGAPQIYVDSVNRSTAASSGSLASATNTEPIHLGCRNPADLSTYFNGTIDEFTVYQSPPAEPDIVLSSARIAAHYAAGTNPWKSDRTDVRINKLLDAINFPASLLAQVTDAAALTVEERRANAFHEAGHVVIGELWDVPCFGATIGAPGAAGRALVPPTGDVTVDVMVRFGGWYAERKAHGAEDGQLQSFGMHDVTGDGCFSAQGSDFAAILDLIGDDEATLIGLGQRTAGAFEDERVWAMVEALAEPLAERGWLSGAEVRAILDRVQSYELKEV